MPFEPAYCTSLLYKILAAIGLVSAKQRASDQTDDEIREYAQTISHELRAPLRGIQFLADRLSHDLSGQLDDDGQKTVDAIKRRAAILQRMVADLLNYSRADYHHLQSVDVRPHSRLHEIAETLSCERRLTLTIQENLPSLRTSPAAFDLIFRNMIINAIENQQEDSPKIEIDAVSRDKEYIFRVTDNGPGIAKEFRGKVFAPLTTLKSREQGGGSGMGLAIARRAATRIGGRIWIEDTRNGSGVTFCVALPRRPQL